MPSPGRRLFWNEATTVALVWTLITYYHFIKVYTGKIGVIDLVVGYTSLFILLVFCFMGFIVKYAYVENGILYNSLGNSIYGIGVASLIAIGAGFYLLIKNIVVQQTLQTVTERCTCFPVGVSFLLLSYTNLIPQCQGSPWTISAVL